MSYKQTRVASKKVALIQAREIAEAMIEFKAEYQEAKHCARLWSRKYGTSWHVSFNHVTKKFTAVAYSTDNDCISTVASFYCGEIN